MGILAHDDKQRVAAITADLTSLRLDGSRGIESTLPEITALTGLDNTILYSLRRRVDRVEIERWHAALLPVAVTRVAQQILTDTPTGVFYDLVRPEPRQRNRVVDATAWIDRDVPGTWEQSRLCREVFAPNGMTHHTQIRVLICEGSTLLGWFGSVHAAAVTSRQKRLLAAIVPAMRARLSVERRLAMSERVASTLDAALEQIGAAAFVVGARGEICETNTAGRALLAARGTVVARSLADAIARRPSALPFELIEIREPGLRMHHLAIAQLDPAARLDARVQAACTRWRLTPRQSRVLELIAQGLANATIATTLEIGERAVEFHVTAIFNRIGVDSRSALVARVLAT